MRAEKDIRIRNRMMAVLGVLKGRSTRTVPDFADADTVRQWQADTAGTSLDAKIRAKNDSRKAGAGPKELGTTSGAGP